jgi:hypothetical protein
MAEQLFAQTRMRAATADDVCLLGDVGKALGMDDPLLTAVVRNVVNEDLFLRRAYPRN